MYNLQKKVYQIIEQKYKVLETIDIFDYGSNIDNLYKLLANYENYVFLPNERILILHHDTDYYVTTKASGFTIYNLILILNKLNIPNEFIVMLTNHYGIEDEIQKQFQDISGTNIFKIIYTSLWYDFPEQVDITEPESGKLKKLYCCLNGAERLHRVALLCNLEEKSLIENGMISYHFNKNE